MIVGNLVCTLARHWYVDVCFERGRAFNIVTNRQKLLALVTCCSRHSVLVIVRHPFSKFVTRIMGRQPGLQFLLSLLQFAISVEVECTFHVHRNKFYGSKSTFNGPRVLRIMRPPRTCLSSKNFVQQNMLMSQWHIVHGSRKKRSRYGISVIVQRPCFKFVALRMGWQLEARFFLAWQFLAWHFCRRFSMDPRPRLMDRGYYGPWGRRRTSSSPRDIVR